MEILEKLLNDLSSVIEENSDATLESFVLATNIFAFVSSEEGNTTERLQQYNLLFNSENPPSLLKFLSATVKIKDKDLLEITFPGSKSRHFKKAL